MLLVVRRKFRLDFLGTVNLQPQRRGKEHEKKDHGRRELFIKIGKQSN